MNKVLFTLSLAAIGVCFGSCDHVHGGTDSLCGARCVRFVIRNLQANEVDLLELSREMGVNLDVDKAKEYSGTSIYTICATLEARGLYTRAVRLRPWQRIRKPLVSIVHVELPGSEGHYIVRNWFEGEPVLWDGALGYCSDIPFGAKPTGYCIVVSPEPLPTNVAEVRREVFVGGLLLVVAMPLGLFVWLSLKRKVK